jgi:flagellar protein FliS
MTSGEPNLYAPSSNRMRSQYVNAAVETMSPGRQIVALYDRLLLDLERAQDAIVASDPAVCHECLLHAQSIVATLHDALDIVRWPAGKNLADLYLFVHGELVQANLAKDPERVASCRTLIEPLRDAWREAAGIVPSAASGSNGA